MTGEDTNHYTILSISGDGGYDCKPYLLTPLLEPKSRAEKAYNYSHIRKRNVIERSFGVLKKRFGCLSAILKQDLTNSLNTITACFILHNFLRNRKDDFQENTQQVIVTEENIGNSTGEGCALRVSIINRYFK